MKNEPITREEILLNAVAAGEAANLEPITREEMFLAKLGGADVKIPTPITRKEQFLQKAIEGGGTPGGGGGGSEEEWIGDGNTHIWIHLEDGRTSPVLGVCPNGTVTVDWGDGTEPDILTGTSIYTVKWTPKHEYVKPGDYVITLTVDGEMSISSNTGGSETYLLRATSESVTNTNDPNRPYLHSVRKCEIGNGVSISQDGAFGYCGGMTDILLPNGINKIGNKIFYFCYDLENVILPDGLTTIGKYAFYDCHKLKNLVFPASVNSIGISAFNELYVASYYDFSNHSEIPTLGGITFNNMPSDCEIRVPAALLDEWKAATNWSNYASKIVGV